MLKGQLTTVGQQQAYDLGKWLHEEYIKKHNLISTKYCTDEIKLVHWNWKCVAFYVMWVWVLAKEWPHCIRVHIKEIFIKNFSLFLSNAFFTRCLTPSSLVFIFPYQPVSYLQLHYYMCRMKILDEGVCLFQVIN